MNTTRLLAPAFLLAFAACSANPGSRALPPAEFVPVAGDDGVMVWSGGADAWLVDEKDRELRSALALVDARISELPEELEQPEFPLDAIRFAIDVLASPMSLRLALDKQANAMLPFRAQLTVEAREGESSEAMAERLSAILGQYGVPSLGKSESMHGLSTVPLGPLSAYHGALGNQLVVAVGDVEVDMPKFGSLDLPEDVRPFFAFKVDYRQIGDAMTQAVQIAAASAGQDADELRDASLGAMMWMQDTVVQGGMGYGSDRLYGATRTQGYVTAARDNQLLASGPLDEKDLKRIPSDATWAAVWRMNPKGVMAVMRQAITAQVQQQGGADVDPFEMIENVSGLDVEEDLFDTFGETAGMYTSVATGGGGWTSVVAFSAVANEKKLRETMAWVESEINSLAAAQAEGYVSLRVRHVDGQHLTTLTFPGLPIPVELSYALADGYVYFALSPQALLAAIRQARDGESGLAQNPRFAEVAGASLDDVYSIAFVDVPALVRDGYSLVNLGCAALDNALRSKSDPARDPGIVMPSYHELEQGAKAFVQIGRLEGDDSVVTWQADRSVLVNACGMSGLVGGLNGVAAFAGLIAFVKIAEDKRAEAALEQAMELEETQEAMEDALDQLEEEMDDMGDPEDEGTPPVPVPENDPK